MSEFNAPNGVLLSGQEVYASRGRRGEDKRQVKGEVVRREEPRKAQAKNPAEDLTLDRRVVLGKKPKDRVKWLSRACEALRAQAVDPHAVFELLSYPGFAEKVTPRQARSMLEMLEPNMSAFTPRQAGFLKSGSHLQQLAATAGADDEDDEDGARDRKRQKTEESEGVERRIDAADGQAYSLEEFIAEYGGSKNQPPAQWRDSAHTSFMFRS
jgi:hypothetical protein